jgi:ABC-2 type transport system ATP-binding protein
MPAALRIHDVRFTYPARARQPALAALHGVSLEIEQGAATALLGPNGSGKSTLMRIIAGLLRPSGGDVRVFGHADSVMSRPLLSVVFQSPGLDRHMTVQENLRDQAALYGLASDVAAERIEQELRRADLLDRRRSIVKTLSGGLVRRADLCRAMLHHPRLLLLDEPTVGLDPVARERFLHDLEQRRSEDGLSVLISTHLVDEADRCDRVALMHHGRVVAHDSPANLRRELGAWRITVMGGDAPPPLRDGIRWRRAGGGWLTDIGHDQADAAPIAAALAADGWAFTLAPPTLADVFQERTGTGLDRHVHQPEAGHAEGSLTVGAEPRDA